MTDINRLLRSSARTVELVWWYIRSIFRKMPEDDVLFLASGIAFNGILTLIPLLLLGAALLGSFLNSSELAVSRVNDVLSTLFPSQPFATSIKESLGSVISDIIVHRQTIGLFGVLVLLFTASTLFDSVRSALATVFRVHRSRGVLRSFIRHIGFVFLAFVLFLGSTISVWFVSVLEGLVIHVPAFSFMTLPRLHSTLPTITIFVLTTCMFYIIYRHIPDVMPPRVAALISTITTSVLWVISGRLFALYLANFSAIGKIYGPYAFIVVLLIWIYYSSLIFLIGAIVGQVHWERTKSGER